jgi:hypothetical protein
VILAYLENGRLEKVVCLQKILLELEKNSMGPSKILKVVFEELMTPSDDENKVKQVKVWSQKQRNHKLLTYWEFQLSHFTPLGR